MKTQGVMSDPILPISTFFSRTFCQFPHFSVALFVKFHIFQSHFLPNSTFFSRTFCFLLKICVSLQQKFEKMKRFAIAQLYEWKDSENRKPLIIRGARQVGKTWLMQEFAREAFDDYVYINFEDNPLVHGIFEQDFDIPRILSSLSIASGHSITPDTLLLFDEIQEVPRGITALKYFYEKAPRQPIIVAGSMLGIAMHHMASFPVGKVSFLDLFPLSFLEFLNAIGEEMLSNAIVNKKWDLLFPFSQKLSGFLKQYYYVGGMPEVVKAFCEGKDVSTIRTLQQAILDSYDSDFSKHAPIAEVPRIRMIWNSIIGQLAKENRKFIYGMLRSGARAKDFELAIEWLVDAGLVYQVRRTKRGELPLKAFEDFSAFKLFILDVGLLTAMANLPPTTILEGDTLFSTAKGALTEQYVLQQMRAIEGINIYYWSAENSSGELDFLIQKQSEIIPIEVKAAENLQSKSLRYFIDKNPPLRGLRFSMSDFRTQEWMTNVPLYGVEGFLTGQNESDGHDQNL